MWAPLNICSKLRWDYLFFFYILFLFFISFVLIFCWTSSQKSQKRLMYWRRGNSSLWFLVPRIHVEIWENFGASFAQMIERLTAAPFPCKNPQPAWSLLSTINNTVWTIFAGEMSCWWPTHKSRTLPNSKGSSPS